MITNKSHVTYAVNSIKYLHDSVILHFDSYPLLTVKRESFIFFKEMISTIVPRCIHMSMERLLHIKYCFMLTSVVVYAPENVDAYLHSKRRNISEIAFKYWLPKIAALPFLSPHYGSTSSTRYSTVPLM